MPDERDTRGLFGYEGEGYMHGVADEVEHEVDEHGQGRSQHGSDPKTAPEDAGAEPAPDGKR